MKRIGVRESETQLIGDPHWAMIFYTAYVHERQGSNPRFPLYHREAIRKAMNGKKFEDVILSDKGFPEKVWKNFLSFARPKPNEKITKGVVFEILKRMQDESQPNLISLLKSKSLFEAFEWLDGIQGIGQKLASLFLRDIWSFIGPWANTPKENMFCLQPVDTWIAFWSKICWPDAYWSAGNIRLDSDKAKIKFARVLTIKCLNSEIDPVSFNKGAWFAGSHFEQLSKFFNIPEKRQINLSECVLEFQSRKAVEGIRRFSECEKQKNIFPV